MKLTRSLHVRQFVGFSFGLVLVLAALIGLAGRGAYEFSKRQNEIIQTRSRINDLTLNLQVLAIERADTLRRYLETGEVRLRLRYQSQGAASVTIYTELATLLRSQEEALALQEVLAAEDAFSEIVEDIFLLYDDGAIAQAENLWEDEGQRQQQKILAATEIWSQLQAANNEFITHQARRTENVAVTGVTVFIILAVVAGAGAGVIITRSITRPISRLVEATKSIDFDLTTRVEPDGPQEIAFLGQSLNRMAARLLLSKQALQQHKEQLERELRAASQAQLSFLPTVSGPVSGLDIAFHWQPARELAGDFYTFAAWPAGKVGLVLGDVVGKGAAAAMAGSLTLGLVESRLATYPEPETLLHALNRELCLRFNSHHLRVACLYVIFDEKTRRLSLANAGCIFPYLKRDDRLCEVEAWGVPLGLWPEFEYAVQTILLAPGDLLLLSSDGLVEAQNQAGELFGFARLEAALKRIPAEATAQAVVDDLMQTLRRFTGDVDFSDDVTLIAMRVIDR